jgi:zinc transport system substrate-binding protein
MAMLDHAALYLQIGAPFEGPLLAKMAALMPLLRVIDCRQGVKLEPLSPGEHAHNGDTMDPHIWLDPARMKIIAATSRAALGVVLQNSDSDLDRNLDLLLNEIDLADAQISATLAPFEGREVLVFHPAYGYFTRRYGLQQLAVETGGRAPSARRLASVLATFEDRTPPAIFIQPQFSSSAAQTIADALGCDVVDLDPLAEDYLVNLRTMAARIAAALEG